MDNLITGCYLDFRHFETIFSGEHEFIDSVARRVGGWVVGEGGGKTNLYRLFGVAITSRSTHTVPR